MSTILQSNVLLLFVVVATGLLLGRVRVRGVSLGVSGVLFAGLFVGAWGQFHGIELALPHALRDFGLVVFVYAVGLTSGPGFFSAVRTRGLSLNLVVLASLVVAALAAVFIGRAFGLSPGMVAGTFCGGLTNTPALAAVVELARGSADVNEASLGYSLAYPFGIVGGLLAMQVLVRVRRRTFEEEHGRAAVRRQPPTAANFRVTRAAIIGRAIGELRIRDEIGLVVSRVKHADQTEVPSKYTVLEAGDVVTVVGTPAQLEGGAAYFGAVADEELHQQRGAIDSRRILVSRKDLAGRTIADLQLSKKFGAQVTRLRRADVDMVPSDDVRLELGDRLRVVAPRHQLGPLAAFLGDRELEAADADFVALAIGIALGLLLGTVKVPTPQGSVSLGLAGGPLLVALVLGRVGRSGPLVWSLPFEVNKVLREFGLLLFLATVGVTAGSQLMANADGTGWWGALTGASVTLVGNLALMLLLGLWLKNAVISSLGVASGLQTQPATLAAAHELADGSEEVYLSYALVYPIAMVGKIILAQLVYMLA